MNSLPSHAERQAAEAQKLPAFQYINLQGIRSDITAILSMFGRQSLFGEYTKHDASHIDGLLASLEWLIPEETTKLFRAADWLLLVLSIYLHDIGLVVTQNEFADRATSNFPLYKGSVEAGHRGRDYQAKVSRMSSDDAERFLYQEFVREHHARRIKLWISDQPYKHLGNAEALVTELRSMFSRLDPRFIRDLALICESHHLDDLDDLGKYKTRQPYGNSAAETANLHYIAIILRTADLLHVSRDRAPSISFRLINPSDPKSMEEWKKQMPVVSIRPVPAKDSDGNVLTSEQPTSIGFNALFTDAEGYFALTSYLSYVRKQLAKSAEWSEKAQKKEGSQYSFPWRSIDESNIEAEGFIQSEFEFTLDQGKILDLLTGHTLYNDASVVIRELVQNSIDAVRLEAFERKAPVDGTISINWNPADSLLVIEDTGTGMSQEIIERHFLRAGSSRYQDAQFRKTHPDFSPISRFGIGVLSAFMISDEVEVFTVTSAEDEKARELTLRSLHGKYLIREYDRISNAIPDSIRSHGTRITLRIRAGAETLSVLRASRHWILFPPCEVTFQEHGSQPIVIGYTSPKAAVEDTLKRLGLSLEENADSGQPKYSVREFEKDGLRLAVAVEWSRYFKQWTFMTQRGFARSWVEDGDRPLAGIGTCVEGIRVDSGTPGFNGISLLAIANATGTSAPRTTVARSGFEATSERVRMLSSLYEMYCSHVSQEIEELYKNRNFSPTWAAGEAGYLASPLLLNDDTSRPYEQARP